MEGRDTSPHAGRGRGGRFIIRTFRTKKDKAGLAGKKEAEMRNVLIASCAISTALLLGAGSALADSTTRNARVRIGLEIAPVALDLRGKNRALVGLGSYLVNATGGCNDCHTSPPYAAGGDPFLGQPEVVNVARYLA